MLTAITLYNLSVQIETKDTRLIEIIKDFINRYYVISTEGFGQNAEPTIKMYAGYISQYNAFFFTNNQFKYFNFHLKSTGYELKDYTFINKRDYEHVEEGYVVRDGWILRENQEPVAEFVEDKTAGTRLLPLATGSGKTFIALNSLGKLKNRFAITIMPTFIDKWIADVKEIHDAVDEEIVIIRGSRAIKDIAQLARENDCKWKYYIFSLPTLRNFVDAYERNPDSVEEEYGVTPMELFPLIGIHTMLIDEVHLSFHAIYRLVLYTNIKFLLGLSATLIARSATEARVHRSIFDDENVYHDSMIKKYIKLYPYTYNIDAGFLKKIRWGRRVNKFNKSKGSYSHAIFEQSIMKDTKILKAYALLIDEVFRVLYLNHYLPNDKCIIFVYTIDMATYLTNFFKKKYPDKIVRRYVQDDVYEEMLEGDIIITTIGSAGTGLDIPDLRVGIQTVGVGSPMSNIQSMGRLRKLKDRDVKFAYLYAAQIDRQVQYHKQRLEMFANRVESVNCIRSDIGLKPSKENRGGWS